MDDEYGDADDVLVALAAAHANPAPQPQPRPAPRIQQPTPQRLDRAPPSNASGSGPPKIVQPTPQALPARGSGSSILVSPRQKGNPVLACLKSIPWEYSDIPADYGLGLTTCALFLSLKYHRLHPEYIYTRIRNLQGKYNLRILLTLVDIPNHEDALRELSKTSVVNNVTVILAWSAAEAARYLELYKSYEHAGFSAIRGQQATGYAERLVEFVTVPRNINKADAVALVSTFGSLRHAVNADPEQVAVVGGWGEKKVKAWCKAVEEPFRARKAARRKAPGVAADSGSKAKGAGAGAGSGTSAEEREEDMDDAEAVAAEVEAEFAAGDNQPLPARVPLTTAAAPARKEDQLSDGIAAALARLREKG
ncbi:restriction endonuclease type II-like protein [Achaetomium macrosporum]|uniref:Restriction endonuclease type II-like protein n=1 Tax=Achaetomium macrosporum TaxID=79813 RepID=A0AAN7HH25_9PEZI|nr:restriction endonuclease type II-like protein [Achaetomium macrosporum]